MISLPEYFGIWLDHPDATDECRDNANTLLERVNELFAQAAASGVVLEVNPKTKTQVSGEVYGGFRPQACPIGAAHSSHKVGMGVDVYDHSGAIDRWVTDSILTRNNLFREAPQSSPGWCHLQTRVVSQRTFLP